ncbi:hypothetical protein I4U23_015129 [Adineta vaga]|nr:hypothetical protein I4U23_015129 [Adineta vaga]
MAFYSSYNVYPNQMQYYHSYNYASYYGSPYNMTGGLFYADGKKKQNVEGEENGGGEKVGAKDALDFLKPLWEKILGMVNFEKPSGVSFNQPNFSSCVVWNKNAVTVANITFIGQHPTGIFVNTKNDLFVTNQQNGRLLIWYNGSSTINKTILTNATGSMSIFVEDDDDILVDNGFSNGRVDMWSYNGTLKTYTTFINSSCTGLFVDVTSNLYCSLANQHRVFKQEYKMNSTIVTVAGTGCPGPVQHMLDNPHGIFVDEHNNLFVADTYNNRIQLFSVGQRDVTTVAGFGATSYTFILKKPTSVVLDASGFLFIVDSGNHRIVRSLINGFECLFGCLDENGSSGSQLNSPQAMAFDANGNILVTDFGNHRVQKFILIQNSCKTTATITATTAETTSSTGKASLSLDGVQLNLNPNLLPSGWSLCYNATYSSIMNSLIITTVLSSCNKAKLLLGCRKAKNEILAAAAMGNRADVLYDCRTTSSCTHVANGVGWYFSDSYSWGFVNGNDTVSRSSCDIQNTNAEYRLCWHTKASGGYRCGATSGLNLDTNWEKIIYHSN